MARRILHLLSQRPAFTGSGVSLEAVVRLAAGAGWDQRVVVGVPHDDPHPQVGGLNAGHIQPLAFGTGELCFPLPGMSDVMPYASSRFADLDGEQLRTYRAAWKRHLSEVVRSFRPEVIHTRHIWLLSSLVKDIAPDTPVVNHCHATGLRQMSLCPHLAEEVKRGCARNDRFCVLHAGHAETLVQALGVAPGRVHVIGTGFRQDHFHARGRKPPGPGPNLAYAGKYSHAKGLPQLLDAVQHLAERQPDLVLNVAGDGAGPESEALRRRMADMSPRVVMHGQLSQRSLANLLRRCDVFVLPSFYEGLPLVLIEALACGCRLVCTDLPGLRQGLHAQFDRVLERVPLPRLIGPDVPKPSDLPGFVDALAESVDAALRKPPLGDPAHVMPHLLRPYTWEAVFSRLEQIWGELVESHRPRP